VAPKNAYEVLGLPRGATDDQVRDVQQRVAKEYHSDRDAYDAAKEHRLKEINGAAAELRDPARRAALDQRLALEDRIREAAQKMAAAKAAATVAAKAPAPPAPQSIWDMKPATFIATKITETSGPLGKALGLALGGLADDAWKLALASKMTREQAAARNRVASRPRCRAKTLYGDRCRNSPLHGNAGYCAVHG
jgi:curved DNA-binding protein CbpA